MLASALLLVGVSASTAFAQINITASWDRNTDGLTAGYQVFVGTSPGLPLVTLDTGQATSLVLPLPAGGTYYVAVRGYSTDGTLGPPSVEVVVDLVAAPGKPSALSASVSGATASLTWASPIDGGAPLGYFLSVGTSAGASNLMNGHPVGDTRGLSGALPPGLYFARLYAANLMGVSPPSAEVAFEISGIRPSGPSQLAATPIGTSVQLSWTPPSATSGEPMPSSYVLEAGSSPGSANVGSVNVGNTTSFVVDVPPGTYYVRVRGVGAWGVSYPSNELTLVGLGAPGPPRQLRASPGVGSVALDWRAPATGGPALAYRIEIGSVAGASDLAVLNVGNVTSVAAPVVLPGAVYVRIRAVNSRGVSEPSNEVVVRP